MALAAVDATGACHCDHIDFLHLGIVSGEKSLPFTLNTNDPDHRQSMR